MPDGREKKKRKGRDFTVRRGGERRTGPGLHPGRLSHLLHPGPVADELEERGERREKKKEKRLSNRKKERERRGGSQSLSPIILSCRKGREKKDLKRKRKRELSTLAFLPSGAGREKRKGKNYMIKRRRGGGERVFFGILVLATTPAPSRPGFEKGKKRKKRKEKTSLKEKKKEEEQDRAAA